MVLHADLADVRGHVVQLLSAAQFEQLLIVRGIEAEQRRRTGFILKSPASHSVQPRVVYLPAAVKTGVPREMSQAQVIEFA